MNYLDDLLDIPEFLRPKPKRGRPRKVQQRNEYRIVENNWDEWHEIKQEKYGTRYDLQLGDEAPRIGSGLRIVYVKEGRKWAHMTSHSGDPTSMEGRVRKRFSLKRWFQMKASHEKYLARQQRARNKLRKRANETNS